MAKSVKAKVMYVQRMQILGSRYIVKSNVKVFRDIWDDTFTNTAFMLANDELEAWQKGQVIVNEYNERIKTQRQADRDKAEQDKTG